MHPVHTVLWTHKLIRASVILGILAMGKLIHQVMCIFPVVVSLCVIHRARMMVLVLLLVFVRAHYYGVDLRVMIVL